MLLETGVGTATLRLRVDAVTGPPRTIAERHAAVLVEALDLEAKGAEQKGRGLSIRLGAERFALTFTGAAGAPLNALTLRRLSRPVRSFAALGFTDGPARLVRGVLARPRGLVVVASPQGNGRSETLAALGRAAVGDRRLAAQIAPCAEFELGAVPVLEAKSDEAASEALRALMASETDVILLDAPEGPKVWAAALEASLSGKLVLASLKASDAASAIGRCAASAWKRAALALTLKGVIAQSLSSRLVSGLPVAA